MVDGSIPTLSNTASKPARRCDILNGEILVNTRHSRGLDPVAQRAGLHELKEFLCPKKPLPIYPFD